jgi:hemolysin III
MLNTLKRHATRICTPDQIDLEEHYQTRAEHTADLVVHVVGLTLAAVGGLVLAILSAIYGGVAAATATGIYALCLVAMLTASTVYNLTRPGKARPVLRRLDEAAIFLMIAGSYTPFMMIALHHNTSANVLLVVEWVTALIGICVSLATSGVGCSSQATSRSCSSGRLSALRSSWSRWSGRATRPRESPEPNA